MKWNITADRPVYLQLIEQLELAIVAGEYRAGARLPGVREMAAGAAVNPNTMQRALQELEARGLLNTQRTAGRTVTEDKTMIAQLREQLAAEDVYKRQIFIWTSPIFMRLRVWTALQTGIRSRQRRSRTMRCCFTSICTTTASR